MSASLPRFLSLVLLSGACVVYEDDGPDPVPAPVNYAPELTWADGGCYWDDQYRDFIWWFEADVDDPNGVYDVTQVWVDVYDDRTGAWVDAFELFPTNDPYYWFSDWLGSTTWLDCNYNAYYAEIGAADQMDVPVYAGFVPTTQSW